MRSPQPPLPVAIGIAAVVVLAVLHTDELRERAQAGLGRGMPAREAALARGFVLGQEEEIDPKTKEDFRRAGLSHLLAVSGQNVTLLALLAMPVLAAFGVPLRERLLWVLGLIAVYVPLTGAGPSIQRAAVMGAAGVLATLGGRRASRLYGLGLALLVTLAIDPGIAADIGWQLSFAAVLGILLLAVPLREAVIARLGEGGLRRALAEGVAVTVAATLATAPLIAFHFETFSTTTLVANVLAMPAVAPAMWLGMASAALAQVPGLPLEPLNVVAALLLAYVAQVAAWCGGPSWAEIPVHIGALGLALSYLGIAATVLICLRWARHRRLARVRTGTARRARKPRGVRPPRRSTLVLALAATLVVGVFVWPGGSSNSRPPLPDLRVEVLDVGQGDAILLQPADGPAVLVDGGPPGDDLASKLAGAGVERLGAAVVTHDQSDHAGGIEEILGRVPVARLLYGRLGRPLLAAARVAGAVPVQVAEGGSLRSGQLRIEVLWPPRELLAEPIPGTDPNQLALVLLVRRPGFRMLLTADAEAEAVPLDPGPVDVLKVAHHGSQDAGLADLLDRIRPDLAVISVGEDNPYGHPAPATLATLAGHGIPVLRTDRDGTVEIDVRGRSVSVADD
ncbi:MAG TPA: ComEC/Rec2 family competence protein [Solirubrobacterales bacterium]